MSEPPWKHYARGLLPASPIAKESRQEDKNWAGTDELCALKSVGTNKEKCSFEREFNEKRDPVIGMKSHNILPHEGGPQALNSRNAMLKRLSDCFNYRQRSIKSRTKRHKVLGFYPHLCTIHENVSELANELDATFNSLTLNTNLMSPQAMTNTLKRTTSEFTSCCQTNDQTIASLHEDIKELWMRLENVEKDFAWARDSLLTLSTTDVNKKP